MEKGRSIHVVPNSLAILDHGLLDNDNDNDNDNEIILFGHREKQ